MISKVIKPISIDEVKYRAAFLKKRIIEKETNKLKNIIPPLWKFDETNQEALRASVKAGIALEITGDSGLQGLDKTISDGYDQFTNTSTYKDLSPEFQTFFRVSIFTACVGGLQALIIGLARGDDFTTIITSAIGQGLTSGLLSSAMSYLIGNIISLISSLKIVLSADFVCGIFITLVDLIIIVINDHKELFSGEFTLSKLNKVVVKLLDCVSLTGISIVAANLMAGTPIIGLFLFFTTFSLIVGFAKERSTQCSPKDSIIWSITKGVLSVPNITFGYFYIPSPKDGALGDDQPEELICAISHDLMTDPVYLHGVLVDRIVAVTRINDTNTGFLNEECTLDDIVDLPELKQLIEDYKNLCQHSGEV